MKKIKLIKKLASLTLIGGAILVTLPLTIASCGCGTNVEPSISIDSNGDLWDGATINVALIGGVDWNNVSISDISWSKNDDHTFTKTDTLASANDEIVIIWNNVNIVNVTIPFAINGILLDDGSKVKITNPDGLMVLNLGTNTRLNSETFTSAAIANVNVIKAFSIVPDQTLTTALDNYGKYLCNNMTKLEAIYIKLPPKINNVGASFCHAMFSGCTSLASLPQNFNLPQSINSVGIDFCKIMFSYCTSLKSLPTNFNLPPLLSNVAGDFFSYMFANCTSLQFLPTDFNLPQNIKSDSLDNFCEGMFSGCESLFSLPFDFTIPQSITNVRGYFCRDMFSDCVSLLSLPINFNLPQSLVEVRDMFCANMFQSCTSLESLPFDFTIPQSINLVGGAFCSTMFFACTSLTSNGDARNLDIPNYHTESGSFCDQMFKNSGIINHDTPSPGDQILIKRG